MYKNYESEILNEQAEQAYNMLKQVNDKINGMPRDQYDNVSSKLREYGIHYNCLDDAMTYLCALGSVVEEIINEGD